MNNSIPVTSNEIYKELRSGYTGGHTDLYKFKSKPNQKV
jgi:hypothetical protein